MGLFSKKKKDTLAAQVPFPGANPQLPRGQPYPMPPQKGTLAQNLGLDKDIARLPPLPEVHPKDSAPSSGPSNLPPLPPLTEDELPPLPDDNLPPLPSSPVMRPMGVKPSATPEPKAPVFIRLDKYQEILDTVDQMESRINNLQNAIKKIGDIKAKEKEIIDNWASLLWEAKEKVKNVNARLPNANNRNV